MTAKPRKQPRKAREGRDDSVYLAAIRALTDYTETRHYRLSGKCGADVCPVCNAVNFARNVILPKRRKP